MNSRPMAVVFSTLAMIGLSHASEAKAQPAPSDSQASTQPPAEDLEQRRKAFAWLLGTWKGEHMFGANSNRSGAQITFYMEGDGTVSARLDKASEWMEMDEKHYLDLVGQTVIRGITTTKSHNTVWTHSATGGMVIDPNTADWKKLGLISVDRKTGKLSHLGGMSDLSHWVKISSQTRTRPQPVAAPSSADAVDETALPYPVEEVGASPRPGKSGEADEAGECDWRTYFQYVRDNGEKLIQAFENDTRLLVEQDEDNVIDAKLFPYSQNVRASYVSYDQNAAIVKWESLAEEMIANQGADDWLKKARQNILKEYRETNRIYWQSAYSSETCPGWPDPAGQRAYAAPSKTSAAVAKRYRVELAEDMQLSLRMQQEFIGRFYQRIDNSELLSAKLHDAVTDRLMRVLDYRDIPEKGNVAREVKKANQKLLSMQEQGIPLTRELIEKEMREALKRGKFRHPEKIAAENPEGRRLVGELAKWGLASSISYISQGSTLFNASLPGMSGDVARGGNLLSAKDHVDVFNALFSLGTLNNISDKDLPTVNALREDVAHLEVLIRRYELFHKRDLKFRDEYRAMFKAALEASKST